MNKKLELVDFLRGFAIFTIALMHLVQGGLSGVLNKAAAFGGAGVHVFILVSGFGLYLSYMRKPLGYGEFLKKRFGKVYWPYAMAVLLWVGWVFFISGAFPIKEIASHLLLYKMFDADLDVSLCYPFWFISTIIQFYICWPIIVRLAQIGKANDGRSRIEDMKKLKVTTIGLSVSLVISLVWATVVGTLGYEELRPWGSCFLQYLWEFVLGMWLAEKYAQKPERFDIGKVKWIWVMISAVVGMCLTGFMGWKGGILKLYNDIPSLIAYLSCLLIVYKLGVRNINRFFVWASSFGYELYLIHSLVFSIIRYIADGKIATPLEQVVCFIVAYLVAWLYRQALKSTIYR